MQKNLMDLWKNICGNMSINLMVSFKRYHKKLFKILTSTFWDNFLKILSLIVSKTMRHKKLSQLQTKKCKDKFLLLQSINLYKMMIWWDDYKSKAKTCKIATWLISNKWTRTKWLVKILKSNNNHLSDFTVLIFVFITNLLNEKNGSQ